MVEKRLGRRGVSQVALVPLRPAKHPSDDQDGAVLTSLQNPGNEYSGLYNAFCNPCSARGRGILDISLQARARAVNGFMPML
jgi:hypothetical protein